RRAIQRLETRDEGLYILLEHQGIGTQRAVVLIFWCVYAIPLPQIGQRAMLADEIRQTLVKTDTAFNPDGLMQHFVNDRIDQKNIVVGEHARQDRVVKIA